MGFEQEAMEELARHMHGRGAYVQEKLTGNFKGEPLIIRELAVHGTRTPSQLAEAAHATSGRISAVLSSLERKGLVTREIDPDDRRVILVNLTDAGREENRRRIDQMRSMVCWIFSQMGERRTREFVDLVSEFTTYLSLCHPDGTIPTHEQIAAAFADRQADDAADAEPGTATHRHAGGGERPADR